ncbi:MAG: aldehyde dehydrogenase family protein [Phycisphaerales bacterium]
MLTHAPANLIGGVWKSPEGPGSSLLRSVNPANGSVVWQGTENAADVPAAVAAARAALPAWRALGLDGRVKVLRKFQEIAKSREDTLAKLLAMEVGKVLWDAKAEAGLLSNKVDITLDTAKEGGLARVTPFEVNLSATRVGRCDFRSHGVMAVIGPFNFPAHLPNGHIVPALAMGNTVVFKPSDKAPGVGQMLVEMFDEAMRACGAPAGVVNLVQGGVSVAKALVASESDVDGVLFTGSWPVGRSIMEASLDRPGRLLALEMGGNNAAIVMPDCDLKQALIECVRSAFVGTGQRCTCTRRIIVHRDIATKFVPAFCKMASNLIVGDPFALHPAFMGPIISRAARDAVLRAQSEMAAEGGEVLVQATAMEGDGNYITPGVVRVESFTKGKSYSCQPGTDVEVFGPLVRICEVESFDRAITLANETDFGLAASLFTKDDAVMKRFLNECRAGCLNINTGTAGASSKLPFGGLGLSGNHRAAGSFSTDYCAYPVASMIERSGTAAVPVGMRVEEVTK